MKTIGKTLLAVLLFVISLASLQYAYAQDFPKQIGYVNDFASLLPRGQASLLNQELALFEMRTKVEVVVVTVESLGAESIEDYVVGLGITWNVGSLSKNKRGQNRGIIFLVAPEQKMRIEVPPGVSAILTEVRSTKIRNEVILPKFNVGKTAKGIIDGTHAIMSVLERFQ